MGWLRRLNLGRPWRLGLLTSSSSHDALGGVRVADLVGDVDFLRLAGVHGPPSGGLICGRSAISRSSDGRRGGGLICGRSAIRRSSDGHRGGSLIWGSNRTMAGRRGA